MIKRPLNENNIISNEITLFLLIFCNLINNFLLKKYTININAIKKKIIQNILFLAQLMHFLDLFDQKYMMKYLIQN